MQGTVIPSAVWLQRLNDLASPCAHVLHLEEPAAGIGATALCSPLVSLPAFVHGKVDLALGAFGNIHRERPREVVKGSSKILHDAAQDERQFLWWPLDYPSPEDLIRTFRVELLGEAVRLVREIPPLGCFEFLGVALCP